MAYFAHTDSGDSIPIVRFATEATLNTKIIFVSCFAKQCAAVCEWMDQYGRGWGGGGQGWAGLGGELSSSSIVCMPHEIMQHGEAEASDLHTVSRVFDEVAKSDERRYIRPVEQKIGKQGLHLSEDKYRMLAPLDSEYVPVIPSYVANIAAYCKA